MTSSRGKNIELDFWEKWFKDDGGDWKEDFRRRLDPECPLMEYFDRFIGNKSKVKILDVGAGPITSIGYKREDTDVQISAVDPLAEDYEALLREMHIVPPVKTTTCKGEELSSLFSAESFDIVTAFNSLDHSENPLRSITEMIRVAKPGGWVLLNHNENEGKNENYIGFHQWNFRKENGRFIIEDRSMKKYDVEGHISHLIEYMELSEIPNWVQVHLKKKALGNEDS